MSFGFSVGDFIAAANLIKDIISALNTSSTSEYRELKLELYGLQRALDEIEHLKCDGIDEAALNAVKVAALMCQHPLNEFASKLKKFETLGEDPATSGRSRAKLYTLKLRWGFTMEEEVQRLRAYLIAHVGSLNMRLTTLSLKSSSTMVSRIDQKHDSLLRAVNASQDMVDSLAQGTDSQTQLIIETQTWLQSFANLVNSTVVTQLGVLVDLVGKVWIANGQIMDILIKQQQSGKPPDIQHTWFQQPVKFEDALGRVIPIPSEYNWSKVNAIVLDQFKDGPGHEKALCGEFELFNTRDTTQIISVSESQGLVPGMSITMAFVIGLYMHQPLKQCPRPGCRTQKFNTFEGGGKTCSSCKVWFDISRKALPRPFRMSPSEDIFKKIRTERKWFKNVRLVPSEVPSMPPVADARGYWVKGGSRNALMSETTSEASPRLGLGSLKYGIPGPPESRADGAELLSAAKVDISPELAREAIQIIAEDLGMEVRELRALTDFTLVGIDSLNSLVVVDDLLKLGVEVPKNGYGNRLMGEDLEIFLLEFVKAQGNACNGV